MASGNFKYEKAYLWGVERIMAKTYDINLKRKFNKRLFSVVGPDASNINLGLAFHNSFFT